MNSNLIMFLLTILTLLIGAGAGFGITYLIQKGKDPKTLLGTVGTVLDGVTTANDTFGKLIPAPAEFLITKVLLTAQAGVHAAQQLYDSSQLTEDERKQKAFEAAMNLLKLEGYQPTPELEVAVKDAIETGVFVMKNINKPSVVTPVVVTPVVQGTTEVTAAPDPVAVAEDQVAPAPDSVTADPIVLADSTTPVAQPSAIQSVLDAATAAGQEAYNQVLTDSAQALSAQAK